MVGTVSADTLVIYNTGTADGYTGRLLTTATQESFSTIHSSAGNDADTAATLLLIRLRAGNSSATYTQSYLTELLYNTTVIDPTSTITAATLATTSFVNPTQGFGGSPFITVTNISSTGTGVSSSDWVLRGNIILTNNISISSVGGEGSAVNFTFTPTGLNYIIKGGTTRLAIRNSHDINNVFGGTWVAGGSDAVGLRSSATTGLASDPFLEVVYTTGGTPPTASFTLNKNFLRIPNSVTATDTSTNTPTSWQWSWGDGTANSTTQTATHTYTKRGKFDIILSVADFNGGSNTSAPTSVKVVGYENYY